VKQNLSLCSLHLLCCFVVYPGVPGTVNDGAILASLYAATVKLQ